jgi:hypothetical protein
MIQDIFIGVVAIGVIVGLCTLLVQADKYARIDFMDKCGKTQFTPEQCELLYKTKHDAETSAALAIGIAAGMSGAAAGSRR